VQRERESEDLYIITAEVTEIDSFLYL